MRDVILGDRAYFNIRQKRELRSPNAAREALVLKLRDIGIDENIINIVNDKNLLSDDKIESLFKNPGKWRQPRRVRKVVTKDVTNELREAEKKKKEVDREYYKSLRKYIEINGLSEVEAAKIKKGELDKVLEEPEERYIYKLRVWGCGYCTYIRKTRTTHTYTRYSISLT